MTVHTRCVMAMVVLFVALPPVSTAMADGVILNGISPRSIGRGGTNIAHADNGAVLFDNPAAAVNVPGSGLVDVGADLLVTDFEYADPDNRAASSLSATPLPQASVIKRSADRKWAYGIGVFTPAGFRESYGLEGPQPLSGHRTYKSIGVLAKILPALAYRLTDKMSVGATFGVGISHLELEGPHFLQSPGPLQGTPTELDLQGTAATVVWSLGLQYELSHATTVAAAFQSESRFQMNGSTDVQIPTVGQSEFDSEIDITWPRSLGLGVQHELSPSDVFSADVIWFDWSSSFDSLNVRLTQPTNPAFRALSEQLPLDWQDSVSVRLGFEHHFDEARTVRLGYVFHRNPIPDETLTPFLQAILEHGFSIGYGWQWKNWSFDVSYMLAIASEQAVGDSDLLGGDFDSSTHNAKAHLINFSAILRY